MSGEWLRSTCRGTLLGERQQTKHGKFGHRPGMAPTGARDLDSFACFVAEISVLQPFKFFLICGMDPAQSRIAVQ